MLGREREAWRGASTLDFVCTISNLKAKIYRDLALDGFYNTIQVALPLEVTGGVR